MDMVNELGLLVLGSRLRRLSDRIMVSGQEIYRSADIDFEPRWFPVYRVLADQGPISVGACARRLGITHAAVSQTVNAMNKRGMVESKRDPEDERCRLLELSEKGRGLLPQLRDIWEDIERGCQEAVDYGGMDILAALEGIEQALAVQSLSERVGRHRALRQMAAAEIVDFKPEYREYFKTLNLEWVEKYFEVEPLDREILWNPEGIIEAGGLILFAKYEGEIVGTCALAPQGDKWELTKMAVTEAHQGKKIGKKLMISVIERAKAMGLESIFLVTNSGLTAAVSLYRKMGFRVKNSGSHDKYERGDLTMELVLT